MGFSEAAYRLDEPLLTQSLEHGTWLNGGVFGVEAGVVGIAFQILMLLLVTRFARGRHGPWRVDGGGDTSATSQAPQHDSEP